MLCDTRGAMSWTSESSLYCMAPMINVCQDVRWVSRIVRCAA